MKKWFLNEYVCIVVELPMYDFVTVILGTVILDTVWCSFLFRVI